MFISGFQIGELLFKNTRTLIHRAIRLSDGLSVIIKQPAAPNPSYIDRLRLQHEFDVLSQLSINGILRVFSLEKNEDRCALILEDFQGVSLASFIKQHGALPLAQFFVIARQLCQTLQHVHAAGVIHKDINPYNFLLQEDLGQFRLIDFGVASLLPQHAQGLVSPDSLEGTLPYIAPEQTGRMNRGIDYRSDYYSLGATFYEMLTGRKPFQAEDALGWVHSHIAKTPPPLRESRPDLPVMLEAIVLKLLAKNAESRYQSMAGLLWDLQLVQTGITNFDLAQHEVYEQFKIPQKLYGRQAETQILQESFQRIAKGSVEMLLVAGYSGIGKSALVNEIHKPLVERQGWFIAGKFEQFQRDIPYFAIRHAFDGLMRQLLSRPKEQLQAWQQRLVQALSPNGQVIIDLIPSLEKVIGPQPAVAHLGSEENQNRFNQCFLAFLQVFTRPECPLVLFLDDLQWADSATLNLIHTIMHADLHHFMLLGAYRDNEVHVGHPFAMLQEELKKSKLCVHELTLKPLVLEDVCDLLVDCVYCTHEVVKPLAELTLSKTGGNPFFMMQFIKKLHHEHLLAFRQGNWQWSIPQIERQDITDNVVEFMLQKLRALPENAQQLLQLSACIGNQFDVFTLAMLTEQSAQQIALQLWPVVVEGLLLPQDETFQQVMLAVSHEMGEAKVRFLHDRVQQAAYALIDDAEKQAAHLKIARLLYQNMPKQQLEQAPFEIVEHYNKARELVVQDDEKQNLARLNLIAGLRAQKSTAYEPAAELFRIAASLLDEQAWNTQHDLLFDIHKGWAECLLLAGKVEEGLAHAQLVLQKSQTREQKVQINNMLILHYGGTGQVSKSVDIAVELLRLFDQHLPRPTGKHHVLLELSRAKLNEWGKDDAYFKAMPYIQDAGMLQVLNLLKEMVASCYLEGTLLMPVVILRLFNLTVSHGNSFASSYVFSSYGLLWSKLGNPSTAYRYGALAMEYNQHLKDLSLVARTSHLVVSYCMYWQKPLAEVALVRKQVLQQLLDTGELIWASYLFIFGFWQEVVLSQNLKEVIKLAERELLAAHARKQPEPIMVHGLNLGLFLNWSGKGGASLSHNDCDETSTAAYLASSRTTNCAAYCYAIDRLLLEYMSGNYDAAIAAATHAQITDDVIDPSYNTTIYILFSCLAILGAGLPAKYQPLYKKGKRSIDKWAQYGTSNFAWFKALLDAEDARVQQNRTEALNAYKQAIRVAQQMGSLWFEALSVECYAKFWLDNQEHKVAQVYMHEAVALYQQWGMLAKVKQLQHLYPELLAEATTSVVTQTSLMVSHSTHTNTLDLSTVFKVSQALSSELVLKKLLRKLLDSLLENAGASRGYLLLKQDHQWLLQADHTQVLQQQPFESCSEIPVSLLRYVTRTAETVTLGEARYRQLCEEDEYIVQHQPQSLLVLPLQNHGSLNGVLYLENAEVADVFTPARLELLGVLAPQISISVENALFYQQLEQKVAERTADLEHALVELKNSQQFLVEAEKMAMLGGLVAGVAHEINTPVGIGITAASHLHSRVSEIKRLYQNDELTEQAYESFMEDTLEGSDIILKNLQTAANLVRSFKLVAVDQSSEILRHFHLKEYIQTILSSLKPELKQLAIHIECADEIELNSYPGDFSQIFTNLIMNSIQHGFANGSLPGDIYIEVSLEQQFITIRYRDNGKGIASEMISKVFDPFFTTDRISGRTGLGMHIVYNIVTQRLKGEIRCEDTQGKGALFVLRAPIEAS